MSLELLEYDAATGAVTYTPDKADGPTAGRHTFEVTDFIARLVAHIPEKGQVLQRTYGYYANRARGERRKAAQAPEAEPAAAEIDAATIRGLEPALAEAATVEPADFSRADADRGRPPLATAARQAGGVGAWVVGTAETVREASGADRGAVVRLGRAT